ncbi:ornithine aminotransferase [Microbotryum lychnidis-dioicae p1A1 Lamole]|uniref:Ornithine aminotransferase n=1 Tax=Microbotryum lychnidis-dioicae (strain p1A1 Lamole / MvSl-1064) TaxID=683840 RepID=U5HC43_USTV1|nr:ornithine aminotransferase [Microbotryum lychnidis-dioicae p1A1 Lamole]|eukprot:KDE04872.1 ornithine aminotransferase [Microbotryum lychnidis-dioicae p1A1 Lamole]
MSPDASSTQQSGSGSAKLSSQNCIELEQDFAAHNYHPLPIVFERASGAHVWDPEGNKYIDCLSAYSAVNQGHCHPFIVNALTTQAQKLTLSSRAFHTSSLGPFSKKICSLTGFEMALMMNTGAEAVETAIKLARKWAYKVKGVEDGKAIVLSAEENFHGRTIAIVSMSTDPESRREFGPFTPNLGPRCPVAKGDAGRLPYNDVAALERALNAHGKNVAAFIVEPIQGEAGIVVPEEDYLEKVQALCKKHNVLLICDEVQTGLARTGKLLCHQHNPKVKPDMVLLGKALSGGVYPVSAVISTKEVMLQILPGEHGSTYGGNPLACAVASAALDVLVNEQLSERAERLGQRMRKGLEVLKSVGPDGGWITTVRGKGLLNAIVIDQTKSTKGRGAWDLCLLFKSKGLLAKPTHVNIIRLAPPLVIEEEDLERTLQIIKESLEELDTIESIPGAEESHH